MFSSSTTSRNRALHLIVSALSLFVLGPAALAQTTTLPEIRFVPDEPDAVRENARFGFGVALVGGTAVIGAPETDGHGAVYVFTQSGGQWPQTQKLVAPDIAEGRFGTSVAIGIDSIFATDPVRERVYVFQQPTGSTTWRATAILKGSTATPGYGHTMATAGCVAMITSTPNPERHTIEPGYVHLYNRCTGVDSWKYIRSITVSGSRGDDQFGASIALHGQEMMVGAPGEDGGKGAVYYYVYAGNNTWNLTQRIVQASPRADFGFGAAVDFHDSLAVIGLPDTRTDQYLRRRGLALTFQRTGQTWAQTGEVMPSEDQGTWSRYGATVAVTADRVIIAAPNQFDAAVDTGGIVGVYKRTGGTLQIEEWLGGHSETFGLGMSLSVSGRGLLLGAPLSTPHRPDSQEGVAYLYQLPQ
jgi:hypothetical protein